MFLVMNKTNTARVFCSRDLPSLLRSEGQLSISLDSQVNPAQIWTRGGWGGAGACWVSVHAGGLDDFHVFGPCSSARLDSALTMCLLLAPGKGRVGNPLEPRPVPTLTHFSYGFSGFRVGLAWPLALLCNLGVCFQMPVSHQIEAAGGSVLTPRGRLPPSPTSSLLLALCLCLSSFSVFLSSGSYPVARARLKFSM